MLGEFESKQVVCVGHFSREEVYEKIGEIVSQFTNLQCDQCAQAVMQWLELNEIEGTIIQLRTKRRNDFFIVALTNLSQITECINVEDLPQF